MPTFAASHLEALSAALFQRLGAPATEARLVARLLVEADLMGLHSHGVLRVPQYAADIRRGTIVPGAEVAVRPLSPSAALVDGRWNFGQVGASRAAEEALALARTRGLGCAVLRRCRHVGRVGAYTEQVARHNAVALACCSTAGEGHWVAPFGGRQGRLGTNPLSFAAPTSGHPLVLDFSTSALPEGRVRLLRDTGRPLPPDALLDREGRPSTDPADLYAADGTAAGAIASFGGAQGYKSFGLALMVQILSCLLGEITWREAGLDSHANTLFLLAIDLESTGSAAHFRAELDALLAYVRSSAPAADSQGVLLPGQREFEMLEKRRREGVPLEEGVWQQLARLAGELDIPLETEEEEK